MWLISHFSIEQKKIRMKQEVINYEHDILQNELIRKSPSQGLKHSFRYENWKLGETLSFVLKSHHEHELKWIGNREGSWIIGYFYAMVQLCLRKEELMTKFKYSLYKLCQYCLNLSEQKALIELLNILEKENLNLAVYLGQNPQLEELLVKIFDSSSNANYTDDYFSTLTNYTIKCFTFLTVELHPSTDKILELKIKEEGQIIYLLREFDCYFVLDITESVNNSTTALVSPPKIREIGNTSINAEQERFSPSPSTKRQPVIEKQTQNKGRNYIHVVQSKQFPSKEPAKHNRSREEKKTFKPSCFGLKEKAEATTKTLTKNNQKTTYVRKVVEKSNEKVIGVKDPNKSNSKSRKKSPRTFTGKDVQSVAKQEKDVHNTLHQTKVTTSYKKFKSQPETLHHVSKMTSETKLPSNSPSYKVIQQNSHEYHIKKIKEKEKNIVHYPMKKQIQKHHPTDKDKSITDQISQKNSTPFTSNIL